MSGSENHPIAVLIAALGGQGGGVLTNWLVAAAMEADLPVQSTSIPGVAQRTGATTYYVEVFPRRHADLDGRRPVLGLFPVAGAIDIMIASELVEAGRAIQNGFVSSERTSLIATTTRIYATVEKMEMGDGRFDSGRVLRAATEIPHQSILFDPERDETARSVPLNSILFGAMAGSGKLPMIPEEAFRNAIRASGKAVEANLKGFDLGLKLGRGEVVLPALAEPTLGGAAPESLPGLLSEAAKRYPAAAIRTVELALAKVADYQDEAYARLYLERLDKLLAVAPKEEAVIEETARHLALWMAYEDIVRVADLKSRAERYATVRDEVRADDGQPIRIVEFFKPGLEEVAALLTPGLGRRLLAWGERNGRKDRLRFPMRVNSTSVFGWSQLRLLASLKSWRRRTYRFADEQAMIEQWLDAIVKTAATQPDFAMEVASCARLLKGYGDTHSRGRSNFLRIFGTVVVPALETGPMAADTARLRGAREAALRDPEGDALGKFLATQNDHAALPEPV